ncbi:MAG: phosphatase PAP2 family protein [Alphaproteobacteria bacterium]|nr:phosphatase PAP2 family protein [Alphaproteobacteria bacterium]
MAFSRNPKIFWPIAALAALLAALVIWPGGDLVVSGWFYSGENGFIARQWLPSVALTEAATWLPRAMGVFFIAAALSAALRKKPVCGQSARAWFFLLGALLIGPGLTANLVLKDHWGRARPSQIEQFGGTAQFTPPLLPADQCVRNCAFVSGDASFGFYLAAFAYLAAGARSRRLFLAGLGAGGLMGVNRIAMGAHFMSDVIYAAASMLAVCALVHAFMFGFEKTRAAWRGWLPGRL